MTTRLLSVVTVVLLFAGLIGCKSEQEKKGLTLDGKKIIIFQTMQLRPNFDDYFIPLIEKYEKLHSDVKIEWMDAPGSEYETKLLTSFLAERSPDVINLPSESILDYVDKGLILSLDDLVTEEQVAEFVPTIFNDSAVFYDKIYALPWYASSVVMFINLNILEEAGLPREAPFHYYEDLPEFAKLIREKTDRKYGFFQIYTEAGSLRGMLMDAGVPLLNADNTEAIFYTPQGVEVLKFWTDLYRNKLVPGEALVATHRQPIEYYKQGRLAILLTGPQFIGQIKSDSPEVYENTAIAPLPSWHADHGFNTVLHSIVVSSQTKHPQEAADFAQYVTNWESQLDFCKRVTILPSTVKSLEDPFFTHSDGSLEGQCRMISAIQIKDSMVIRPLPDSRMLLTVLNQYTEAVATGEMEADEALKKAQEKWNAILK